MKGTIGEEKMKKRLELFLIILLPILGLVFLGGKIMTLTKRPEQKVTISSSKKVVQKSEEEIKKEQIAYLKDHEQEIVDFVKSKNSKIDSVQVNWRDIRWGEAGNGTPQGGGEIIELYGGFNHIENSGWNVTIEIVNEMPDLKTMMLSNGFGVGGEVFE